jgi:hypothetical protein
MTSVDLSLAIGFLIALGLSALVQNRRGMAWLVVGAASYVSATLAWRLSLPMAEVITALGDAAVCLGVYFAGRYRWEMWIWRLFQVSVGISTLYLAAQLGIVSRIDHEVYAILLEVVNWLVLLSIGGSAALQWVRGSNALAHRPWNRVRGLVMALWRERRTPPFTKAAA